MEENKLEQPIFPQIDDDEIDLYALFMLLWSKKFIIGGISFALAVAVVFAAALVAASAAVSRPPPGGLGSISNITLPSESTNFWPGLSS